MAPLATYGNMFGTAVVTTDLHKLTRRVRPIRYVRCLVMIWMAASWLRLREREQGRSATAPDPSLIVKCGALALTR